MLRIPFVSPPALKDTEIQTKLCPAPVQPDPLCLLSAIQGKRVSPAFPWQRVHYKSAVATFYDTEAAGFVPEYSRKVTFGLQHKEVTGNLALQKIQHMLGEVKKP